MTSKEALENISWRYVMDPTFQEWCNIVQQDLDRLEKLEKVIEDIKQLPKCEVCEDNWIKGCMCFRKKLKEVLGDE